MTVIARLCSACGEFRPINMPRSSRHCRFRRQRGVFSLIFALCLLTLIAFIGIAIDVGQLYSRKTELQNIADGAARAAAKELDGSTLGISSAIAKAKSTAEKNKYGYFKNKVIWNDAALRFSTMATGADWIDAAAAQAAPAGFRHAKVDTIDLDATHGTISAMFMSVLSPALATSMISASAIAGRPALGITPLAVCAQDNLPSTSLPHGANAANAERLEYGFRLGLGYNLLSPPPVGAGPQTFIVNPIERPNDTCVDAHLSTPVVAPFMRSGTLLFDQLSTSNTVYVSSGFPGALTTDLNSRFNLYDGGTALAVMSPPDGNVKEFTPAAATSWMSAQAVAKTASVPPPPLTLPPPVSPASTSWGVLWSFAVPRRFASNTAFAATPADWSLLYPLAPVQPAPKTASYPSATPYASQGASFYLAPTTNKATASRRVLVIPLLDCSSAAPAAGICQPAKVVGYGRFLMTVAADSSGIYAEFGGGLGVTAAPSSSKVQMSK